MLWSLIKESIPRQLIAAVILSLIFWFVGWLSLAIFFLLFSLELTFYNSTSSAVNDYVYTKDIFNLISIDGEQLRVGMELGKIKDIKRMQLWQQDQHGYLDFTLNKQSLVRYKFPISQYQTLLSWLQKNLPEVTLDTAFTG